jgi:nucleoside-diphosphate-sugar epimerase
MGLHLSCMLDEGYRRLGWEGRVTAVSRFRTLRDREDFDRLRVPTLTCDLQDSAQLAQLPDAPVVFYLAGIKFGTATAPELLHRFNVEMPRLVAERFAASRIVAFSSGNVYPFVSVESGGATESDPVGPVGEYAASCVAREQAFADASRRNGTPVVIIRLNYSVEFRYGVLVDIAGKVLRGEPVDVSTGYVNVIWQRDATAHIIQALALAASPAVPLNVAGEVISVRAVAQGFGRLFGVTPVITGSEAPTALLNNPARSHRLFGKPKTSLEEMMKWIAAWLGRQGETWQKATGFERRDGRF